MKLRLFLGLSLAVCGLYAQGIITTIAGSTPVYQKQPSIALNASFGGVTCVAYSGTLLYFADTVTNTVYSVDGSGNLALLAGLGFAGYGGDGGPGANALLNNPAAVAFDSVSGDLYIADAGNNRIRRILGNGNIATYVGTGVGGSSGDGGPANGAQISYVSALTFDATGNLYFAEGGSRVRMVTPSGTISTIAGGQGNGTSGGDGGPALSATFSNLSGVSFDTTTGNLYVSDSNANVIRRFKVGGNISTVAGNGSSGFSGDGGPATSAQLSQPQGISADASGNLFIADSNNNAVRYFTASSGTISTIAGTQSPLGYNGDGNTPTAANLSSPMGVAAATGGGGKQQVFIADAGDGRIRNVKLGGAITTVAGNGQFYYGGDGGPATSAFLNYPFATTTDAAGNIYVADAQNNRVRKIDTTGKVTTIAGNGTPTSTGDGGPAVNATVAFPGGIVVDPSGNIYVAEIGGNRIRKITPAGTISTIAGNGTSGFSGDGGPATSAMLSFPAHVTLDGAGNIYFVDYLNYRIRMITSAGVISTVAGNGQNTYSGDNGKATSAGMAPFGLAVTSAGVMYISDTAEPGIRKVSGGTITTFFKTNVSPAGLALDASGDVIGCFQDKQHGGTGVGLITPAGAANLVTSNTGQAFAGDGGPSTAAMVSCQGVAVDNSGNILVADAGNNRIRKIFTAVPSITPASTTLNFTVIEGNVPVPQTVNLTGTAGAIVQTSTTTASGGAWLNVSPGFGLLPGPIVVAPFSELLATGSYQGTVTLQIGGVTSTIAVNLTVTAPPAGQLTVTPASLVVTAGTGNARSLLVGVSGSANGAFSASASTINGQGWLSVSPTGGNASLFSPVPLTLTFNTGALTPGVYTGQVSITGGGTTLTVPVRLVIPAAGVPVMVLNQTGLNIVAGQGAALIPRSISVGNAGSVGMPWTASVVNGNSWLSLSGGNGNTPGQSSGKLGVFANAAGLAPGTYYGLIKIAGNSANAINSPQYVTTVLRVVSTSPAGATVYPQAVIVVNQGGGSQQQNVDVTTASPSPVQVSASGQVLNSPPVNWLTVNPANNGNNTGSSASVTVAPTAQLQIGASVGTLAPGVYSGTVTANFLDGSPAQDIRVLLVNPLFGSGGSCSPTRLVLAVRQPGPNFSFTQGWPAPLEAQVYNDCGQPVPSATIVASFSNGDPPLVLNSAGAGIFAGMWKPGASGPVTISVTYCNSCTSNGIFTLNGTVAPAPAGIPSIGLGGVVNGASFAPGADIAPGSIISAFGVNLATSNGNQNGGFPLPTTLAGIKLTIGGVDAPLFYSGTGQVNAQVPFEIPPGWQTQVVARATGSGTEIDAVPEVITLSAAHPGIFISAEAGAPNQGAILNPANAVVDAANPSSAGGVIVIYATGLGQATPALATGIAAGGGAANTTVSVNIGGVPVPPGQVQYAGPAPGYVGLYQVNVQIPTGVGVPTGLTVPVFLTQNGVKSNTATIAIH